MADHLLAGEVLPERTVYWRSGNSKAVRWKNWKLVRIHERFFELYNLDNEQYERNNLADRKPELSNELLSRLAAWEADFSR